MSILDILLYPSEKLREVCQPVQKVTAEIKKLADDLAETMYTAQGIGLAAAQVGSLQRVIVVDVGDDEETGRKGRLYKVINPLIVQAEGSIETEEGCLSIPGIRENVKRSAKVVVTGLDENGQPLRIVAEDILAVCLQHEVDHLDGILFLDRLSKLKRELAKRRYRKLQSEK